MVVCGGGCVDTAIAHFIRESARSLGEERKASSERVPVQQEHCTGERKTGCERWNDPYLPPVVMEMVAQCFEAQSSAVSGGHAIALTDSFSHHCWFASPWDAEPMLLTECPESPGLGSRCNCGTIERSSIPANTSWRVFGSAGGDTSLPPPSSSSSSSSSLLHCNSATPYYHLFDLLSPRLGAISCASGLCDILLTTAFFLT